MAFLDSIGQHAAESSPQKPPLEGIQRLTFDNSTQRIQAAPAQESRRSARSPAGVIWGAGAMVVAAVAITGWLGIRNYLTAVAPSAQTSSDAPVAAQTHREEPAPKVKLARPASGARSAASNENAIDPTVPDPQPGNSAEASLSGIAPATHVPVVTEREAAPIENISDRSAAAGVAAVPEDNYVYSSEAAGVIAPRLVSLGFVGPLVRGFETRTTRLELLISRRGAVERARIFSPSRNWEDAMLLSRAKTFQFVPAQREGRPVRYRLVMTVDATP